MKPTSKRNERIRELHKANRQFLFFYLAVYGIALLLVLTGVWK